MQIPLSSAARRWSTLFVALVGVGLCGCHAAHHNAIPATRLPLEWQGPCRDALTPIDFTLLRQNPPAEYLVGPRDVLGIHIQNVLGGETDAPPFTILAPDPAGVPTAPAVGHPVTVQTDGMIALPLIPPLRVEGLSTPQIVALIRKAYAEDRNILQAGRDRISVNLMRPRSYRVMVIRQDTPTEVPILMTKLNAVFTKRGSAAVIDLPAYENDVLHALVATGGLPGVDSPNVVWILRGQSQDAANWSPLVHQINNSDDPEEVLAAAQGQCVRIPLRMAAGELVPFNPADIVLNSGDVVFIGSREQEFFYCGGLLAGGQVPLPRDYDLDVLGAVAMANGNVNGPAGANAAATNFRSGPGNIVPPSRVIIVRKLDTGGQIKIDVDVKKALDDPRQRVIIQPGDLVLLKYTPAELLANVGLNFVNVNVTSVYSP